MTTLADALSEFAVGTSHESLPTEVSESITLRVLDIVGIQAAAARLDTSRAARNWVKEQGGAAQAHAVGIRGKVTASQAAFVGGVGAHSLDYDDTHLPSILHPSASIVPAVLAAAERSGATGAQAIGAIAVGLEIAVRLGMAGYDRETNSSIFFEHGQHATSICGVMGAAAAVASLHGERETIVHSLGVAASMASGIIEANRTGGTVKRIHCGWAAKSAIDAVDLVRHGFSGPNTVLEGRFGFFQAWLHGRFRPEEIVDGLGEKWSIPDIFFKPYPANHFTHTTIDAAANLRRAGVSPSDVVSVQLGVAAATVRTIGEPLAHKQAPQTGYEAQFSGPYAFAAGIIGGDGLEVGLDDFTDELARDSQRREIMAKVSVVADSECTEIFPRQFPVTLTAMLTNGRTVVEKVHSNRGGNERSLSFDELSRKFYDNALRALDQDSVRSLAYACQHLADLTDISTLTASLTDVKTDADT